MKIGGLTVLGFGVALIGWVLLVAALTISDTLLSAGSLVTLMALRADMVTVAQSLIVSGFGLAVVGTLRAGFGAFTRFFDAVLQRSAAPRPRGPTSLEPEPLMPDPVIPRDEGEAPGSSAPSIIVPERTAAEPRAATERPSPPRPSPERIKANRIKDRNYVVLPDGSVEVETMFGTRIFANLDEAKDFLR